MNFLSGSHWKSLLKRKETSSNDLLKQDSERYTALWSNIADTHGDWDKSFVQKEFKESIACNSLKKKKSPVEFEKDGLTPPCYCGTVY